MLTRFLISISGQLTNVTSSVSLKKAKKHFLRSRTSSLMRKKTTLMWTSFSMKTRRILLHKSEKLKLQNFYKLVSWKACSLSFFKCLSYFYMYNRYPYKKKELFYEYIGYSTWDSGKLLLKIIIIKNRNVP